jgi:hypothetical protein
LLAWDIAANEAAYAKQNLIEPQHLFIGLCKLEDFTSVTALINLGYTQDEAETMQPEVEALITVFYQFGLSPTTLRRELRSRRGTGVLGTISGWTTGMLRPPAQDTSESNVIHRSQASRVAFARADELALMNGSFSTGIAHLMAALIEDPQSLVGVWLRKQRVDIDTLRQAVLDARPITRRR